MPEFRIVEKINSGWSFYNYYVQERVHGGWKTRLISFPNIFGWGFANSLSFCKGWIEKQNIGKYRVVSY